MNYAPVDPLVGFLEQQRKFSLAVFLNTFQRLSIQQSKQGKFDYSDVVQIFSVNLSSHSSDIEAYIRLFYETTTVQAYGFPHVPHNPVLQIRRELLGNDIAFVKALIRLIAAIGGNYHPAVAAMEMEMNAFFAPPPPQPPQYVQPHHHPGYRQSSTHHYSQQADIPMSHMHNSNPPAHYPDAHYHMPAQPAARITTTPYHHPHPTNQTIITTPYQQPSYPGNQARYRPANSHSPTDYSHPATTLHTTTHPSTTITTTSTTTKPAQSSHRSSHRHQQNYDQLPPQVVNAPTLLQAGIELEKLDPIVRFLAQIRKYGMDVLFPQIIHDKILACIYTAFAVYNRPVIHRELVDIAMKLKDCGLVRELESISKTKLRGVLAILKQGDLVMKHGNVGEPVQLNLGEEIHSFSDLREQHDRFLNSYMVENLMNIPIVLKNEILWSTDEAFRAHRMQEMNWVLDKMMQLAKGYVAQQQLEQLHDDDTDLSDTSTIAKFNSNNTSPTAASQKSVNLASAKGSVSRTLTPNPTRSPHAIDSTTPSPLSANVSYTSIPSLEDTYANNIFTEATGTPPYMQATLGSASAYYPYYQEEAKRLLSDDNEFYIRSALESNVDYNCTTITENFYAQYNAAVPSATACVMFENNTVHNNPSSPATLQRNSVLETNAVLVTEELRALSLAGRCSPPNDKSMERISANEVIEESEPDVSRD